LNFLSHYFRIKDADPYYKIGAAVPDIYPKFSFYFNKYINKESKEKEDNPVFQLISNGILKHYEDDVIFHQREEFKSFLEEMIIFMQNHPYLKDIQRKNFLAHIFYEIWLDHLVIVNYPGIEHKFYNDLNLIEINTIESFVEKKIHDKEANQLFLKQFSSFTKHEYMRFYTDREILIKALNQVTGKISKWEKNQDTTNAFFEFMDQINNKYTLSSIEF
jgi:hypothetical protein